jgi:hypothetical protein
MAFAAATTRQMSHSRAHRLPRESVAVVRRFFAMTNRMHRKAGMADMAVKVTSDGRLDRAPTAPRALKVVPADGAGLTLMWKPSVDDGRVAAYRVYKDGKLLATVRGSTWFTDRTGQSKPGNYEIKAVDDGRQVGAAAKLPIRNLLMSQQQAQQGANGAATAPQAVQGALQPPQYTDLKQTTPGQFQVSWKPVEGAVAYGVYVDGKLVGHTKSPQFTAKASTDPNGSVLTFDAVRADGTRSAQAPSIGVRQGQQGVEFAKISDPAPAGAQQAQQGAAQQSTPSPQDAGAAAGDSSAQQGAPPAQAAPASTDNGQQAPTPAPGTPQGTAQPQVAPPGQPTA